MTCQLKMIGYSQEQDCVPLIGGPKYQEGETKANLSCQDHAKKTVELISNSSICPKITLGYFAYTLDPFFSDTAPPAYLLPFLSSLPKGERNLTFIFNYGVHANNEIDLVSTLKELGGEISQYQNMGLRV
eukprot:CAMPEP_0173265212 /NCGR_PEP_ID=MMETSP1142-20121109/28447_1 /TAXON_ID=483371 /ORGANISM="non described non described, Strain CCMP2298" /LENGTH=129 /DNA_ID=CAMNT_0014200921 /DNA_START=132 /DNA_END=518 /DNA_ORIENTATION=+